MDLKNAIVTGGSRGIGRAICLELANKGFNLIINYSSDESAANETAEKCRSLGVEAAIIKANVADYSDCEKIFNAAIENFGSAQILINNAGIARDNILARMKESDFDEVIATNLKGTFNMMKVVTRPMMKQRMGRIINLSSVVGIMGNVGQVNYSASKAGVIGMTKSLARELAPFKVTVNAIAPGFIKTDMTANLPQAAVDKFISAIPLGRLGDTSDVASAVSFFASESAGYITGQVLCVDGGMCMI